MKNGDRACTTKQQGDACEMLIAAEMTLAAVPALKVPDNWPHYDVVAQPTGGGRRNENSIVTVCASITVTRTITMR